MADDAILSQVPPHSADAERSVLASLIIDKESIIKIADLIEPADFYYDQHGIIYEAIRGLYNKRSPIDLVTVSSLLEDKGQLEIIGGNSYLTEITQKEHTATHILQYARIVKHKSTLRKLIKAGHAITGRGYDQVSEMEELLENAEKELFSVSQTFIRDRFVHIKEILSATYEKISELHDPDTKDKYTGVPTGFKGIDKMLSGLHPSDLIIIAARPSMGKTSLALNIAQNIAKSDKTVGIISLEMSKEQLIERMFAALLSVDSWKMKTGKLTEADFARIGQVMDELNKYKLFIDDSAGSSIIELRAKARRLQMQHGLDALIVDYLQLMSVGRSGGMTNRVQEISEISRSLKELARELKIPIIALSQLSRAVEQRPTKIPQLSDLRESGAIEQDACVFAALSESLGDDSVDYNSA